jgi:hypothetical protein
VAPTTASSLSAVLAVLTLLAAGWRPFEQWHPQPLLASADRSKFPFGGKRREREAAEPEPTGPDLLDEVAGGRYGGGQTLLPTLGGGSEKASERKLPRLFPDAPGSQSNDLDDDGFDDDLIGWTNTAPQTTPEATDLHAPPAGPRATPDWLVPPPPPSTPAPGDANWPREMGMLEAIANMDPNAAETTADASPTETEPWGGSPHGGEAAAASLPLEPPVLAPFSDLAPLESWEQRTPPEPPPTASWLSFPGESRRWSTGLESLRSPAEPAAHDTPTSATEPAAEPEAWSAWKWETSDTLSMEPEPTAYALPSAPTPQTADAGVTYEPAPIEESLFEAFSFDAISHESTEPSSETEDEHDRWSGVRWADPVGGTEELEQPAAVIEDPGLASVAQPAPPTFSFALPELSQAWDNFGAREHAETIDEDAPAASSVYPPATVPAPEAPLTTSWSDIFDIFQSDDDPSDPVDNFIDVYDVGDSAGDDESALDESALDESALRRPYSSAAVPIDVPDTTGDATGGATDAPTYVPQPLSAPLVTATVETSDGDRWASTLLDRLRAVVATPAEPVEALAEFNERFERGLRLRLTEQMVIDYLGQGVQMIAPEAEGHLLIGDEGSTLAEMTTVGQATRPGCGVSDTDMCPAIVQDETLRFDNSTFLDACPYLSARSSSACAAVCVPIGEPGATRGVVHITTLLNAALPDPTVAAIERSATQVSTRLITLGATRRGRTTDDTSSTDEPADTYDLEPVESRV